MPEKFTPNLNMGYGWNYGENNWNGGIDSDIALIDALLQLYVKSASTTTPPVSPSNGDRYIVPATGATGAWAGKATQVAYWLNSAWNFFNPTAGERAYVGDVDKFYYYEPTGTLWQAESAISFNNAVFTGTFQAPTGAVLATSPASGDITTKIATTAYVFNAIDGIASVSVAGGSTVNLTAVQAGAGILVLTGALTANISVTSPATITGQWIVYNNTSGAFTLTFGPSGGTGIIIPQGQRVLVYTDGTTMFPSISGTVGTSFNIGSGATAAFGVELGSVTTAALAFIDFHSSGNNIDYDVRVSANGGTSSTGQATLAVTALNTQIGGALSVSGSNIGGTTPLTTVRGITVDWNFSGGTGETDIIMGGPGGTSTPGIYIYSADTSGNVLQAFGSPLFKFTNAGAFSTSGAVTVGGVFTATGGMTSELVINTSGSTPPADTFTSQLHLLGSTGNNAGITMDGFAAGPSINFRRADGTPAAPSALQLGESILQILASGYGATSYGTLSRASIFFAAAENWSDTAQGTFMTFATTATGGLTRSERVRVNSTGNVLINTTSDNATDKLQVSGTANFTSPTSGSNNTQGATTAFVQNAAGGLTSISVAGGSTVALTAAQAGSATLVFTGALTANIIVTVPSGMADEWVVFNNTTGAFTLTFEPVSGSGVVIPQGLSMSVYTDGTNMFQSETAFGGTASIPLITQLLFGSGTDGALVLSSGTHGMSRDEYRTNATISGTGKLITNGFRLFVSGTLDISAAGAGAISNNGVVGNNASGITQGAANAFPTNVINGVSGMPTPFAVGGVGGIPTVSGTAGNGASGNVVVGVGGSSTAGGTGGASTAHAGGSGGTAGGSVSGTFAGFGALTPVGYWGNTSRALMIPGSSGAGGGAGGGDNTNAGGGGGGGGTGAFFIVIAANVIARGTNTTVGIIQAIGGAGGNGGTPAAGNAGGGGAGSPGGGGYVWILAGSLTGTQIANAVDVSGGAGGNGGNGLGTGAGGFGTTGGSSGGYQLNVLSPQSATQVIASNAAGTAPVAPSGTTGGTGGTGAVSQGAL